MQNENVEIIKTMQQLLNFEKKYSRPQNLLFIVLKKNRKKTHKRFQKQNNNNAIHWNKRTTARHKTTGKLNWGRNEQAKVKPLQQSKDSFSANRHKLKNQKQSAQIISTIKTLLNKVTVPNFAAIQNEIVSSGLVNYGNSLNQNDFFDFFTAIANLIVAKSQQDQSFIHLYAQIINEITKKINCFGAIIFDVCEKSLPEQFDPNQKRNYLGSLLLLSELFNLKLTTNENIRVCVEVFMTNLKINTTNSVVFSISTNSQPQNKANKVNNSAQAREAQLELCIELLCKFLPTFLKYNAKQKKQRKHESWIIDVLNDLKELQTNKEKIKARLRFMLLDFFNEIKK